MRIVSSTSEPRPRTQLKFTKWFTPIWPHWPRDLSKPPSADKRCWKWSEQSQLGRCRWSSSTLSRQATTCSSGTRLRVANLQRTSVRRLLIELWSVLRNPAWYLTMTTGKIFRRLSTCMSLLPGVTVKPSAIWSCLKSLSLLRHHKLLDFWEVESFCFEGFPLKLIDFLPQDCFGWLDVWSAWGWVCACRNQNRCATRCCRESTRTEHSDFQWLLITSHRCSWIKSLKRTIKVAEYWIVTFSTTSWPLWVIKNFKSIWKKVFDPEASAELYKWRMPVINLEFLLSTPVAC